MSDSKIALQFIRYYCKDFNIDKSEIALKGGSAGASTCLWIGLNNDMAHRANVDMLSFLTSDDPDIYLVSAGFPYSFPQDKGSLIHHPLQAKSVLDKALQAGLQCKALIPEMNINNTNGESAQDFIIRELRK